MNFEKALHAVECGIAGATEAKWLREFWHEADDTDLLGKALLRIANTDEVLVTVRKERDALQAELAARNERRCETCRHLRGFIMEGHFGKCTELQVELATAKERYRKDTQALHEIQDALVEERNNLRIELAVRNEQRCETCFWLIDDGNVFCCTSPEHAFFVYDTGTQSCCEWEAKDE